MVRHTAIAAAILAAVAVPAAASARDTARETGLAEIERRLGDPDTQQAIGDSLAGLMAAMLDMKAAPFLKAIDRVGGQMGQRPAARAIPDSATLGDLAGPDARRAPREIAQKMPHMVGAMGAMAGAMGQMLPQLERIGRQMGEQMGKTIDRAEGRTSDRAPRDVMPSAADPAGE